MVVIDYFSFSLTFRVSAPTPQHIDCDFMDSEQYLLTNILEMYFDWMNQVRLHTEGGI